MNIGNRYTHVYRWNDSNFCSNFESVSTYIWLFKICIPFDPTILGVCSKTVLGTKRAYTREYNIQGVELAGELIKEHRLISLLCHLQDEIN